MRQNQVNRYVFSRRYVHVSSEEIVQHVGPEEEPSYDSCQGLKLCEAAIEETLRMYPPVHILTRQTTEDTVLNGKKKGSPTMFVSLFLISKSALESIDFLHNHIHLHIK